MPKIGKHTLREYVAGLTQSAEIEEMVAEAPRLHTAEAEAVGPSGARGIMEKVALEQDLSPREQFFLEAVIIPDRRPAIDVVGGTFQSRHPNWLHLNDPQPRQAIEAALPSIGRVEVIGYPDVPYGGTAFVVGDDLLMTNRHVAALFAAGLGERGIAFISGRDSAIDFLRERGNRASQIFDVAQVVMVHPWWDMAMLKVPGLGAMHPPLALDPKAADDLIGREVAVIGYPAFDRRNPADVQARVFDNVYAVKRLQPGKLRGRADVESFDRTQRVPTHDASTLGGNSGSCVVDLKSGHVVGLHFAGIYLKANFCVAASDLALDSRVIDTGVVFATNPTPTVGGWTKAWTEADQAGSDEPAQAPGAQTTTPPPPTVPPAAGAVTPPVPPAAPPAVTVPPGSVNLTIPLHISVSLGTPAPAAGPASVVAAPTASTAPAVAASPEQQPEQPPNGKPFWDPDYTTRRGFDADFLGIPVPLPTPRNPHEISQAPGGGPYLHYHHFSLAMHKERRLAVMSAAMVDSSDAMKRPGNRPPGDYSRDGLAGRSSDAWFEDDRIAEGAQLPDRFFTNDRKAFDRGHVVRRDDVAWGTTYDEMRNANGDSFHSTNCSPQVSTFNQSSRGTDNWGDLENLVEEEAETERLAVFAGPIFKTTDRVFKGVDNDGDVDVQIPDSYWKLIVARKDDALQSFAFILEQDLGAVKWEFAVPPRWKHFMVPVSEIESASGFDFHDTIRRADQFETTEGVVFAAHCGIQPRRGAAAAATESPAAPDFTPEILDDWRERQGGSDAGAADAAIFVVELDTPIADATIARMLSKALSAELEVGPLFESDPALDRYREVLVPGIGEVDREDLFDIAELIRDTLEAASVEPDITSPYYDNDVEERPEEGTAESANFAFWCWADEDEKPDDADWALKRLRLPEAWEHSVNGGRPDGGRGTLVFQPDTGVVRSHRELPTRLADHKLAANFVEPGQPAEDPMTGDGNLGHGTATGSVVASAKSYRVRGAAPRADLVPIRAIRSVVRFRQSPVAKAIDHARVNGAHVITMSLGGVPSRALRAAVKRAVDENVIVMAAAGNCVGTVVWPARYPEVIAVAGSNAADLPWRGSSRGSAVDITAPAEFVLRADSRDPGKPNKIGGGQGTSFAVALTAGVAACWLSHHGRDDLVAGLRPGEKLQDRFRALLRQTAQPVSGLDSASFGPGLPNAEALITTDPVPIGAPETVSDSIESVEAEVIDLFAEIAGVAEESAAMLALSNGASALELAALGLDRARFRSHVRFETQRPFSVSTSLRSLAGEAVTTILTQGAKDA